MPRKTRTKMIIRDVKVQDGRCIISVEIRRGPNVWTKAYGFSADQLKEGEFEAFNNALKQRVLKDSLQLEEDKRFETRVLLRIEDLKDNAIIID